MNLREKLFHISELAIWKLIYVVFLALLPITSMRVWWLRSPVTPENKERII